MTAPNNKLKLSVHQLNHQATSHTGLDYRYGSIH